jgi:hypothetical protein
MDRHSDRHRSSLPELSEAARATGGLAGSVLYMDATRHTPNCVEMCGYTQTAAPWFEASIALISAFREVNANPGRVDFLDVIGVTVHEAVAMTATVGLGRVHICHAGASAPPSKYGAFA